MMMRRIMTMRRKTRMAWPHSALSRGQAVQGEGVDWSSPLAVPSLTNIFAFFCCSSFDSLVFQTNSCSPFVGVSFCCVLNHPCTFVLFCTFTLVLPPPDEPVQDYPFPARAAGEWWCSQNSLTSIMLLLLLFCILVSRDLIVVSLLKHYGAIRALDYM